MRGWERTMANVPEAIRCHLPQRPRSGQEWSCSTRTAAMISWNRLKRYPSNTPVYDLNIENTHNFIANGIVTHNSIYGWRGANPEVVRDFQRDFPTMRVIILEQNYRSTQNILDAAQGVVQRNASRREKQLWTERGGGDKITVHEAYNEEDEAAFVVNEIRRLVARGVCELRDCAVMYRTNAQSSRTGRAIHSQRPALCRRRQQEVLRAQRNQGHAGVSAPATQSRRIPPRSNVLSTSQRARSGQRP